MMRETVALLASCSLASVRVSVVCRAMVEETGECPYARERAEG